MRLSSRVDRIEPFWVMECAKAADEIARSPACDPARGGEPMIYLNIGEPDFAAPEPVAEAAQRCIADGRTQYTQATGLPQLREAISGWYHTRFGLSVDPQRIVVTAGASAALQLVCAALVDPGDEVLMPDPCYPCNRHFVAACGGTARLVPAGAAQRFQLDAASVARAWEPQTRGVLLASPSNPTGTSIETAEMARIVHYVRERGGWCIVDEIYLGLSFDPVHATSTLALGDDVISVNSFSKYFGMTGWRLGWLVLPPALVAPVEKLAQNLYICASAVAQHAALACFDPRSLAVSERRRQELQARRDYIVPELQRLGLPVPVQPDGAFYAWLDTSRHSRSSWDFCFDMMRRAHVALTPGRDFARADADRFARLSFASSMAHLREAVRRLGRELGEREVGATVAAGPP
jgi:aspartate/methionine/tyrosine aminotransferase